MGIVDEALPADGGARLLKVDAHDDLQVGGEFGDGGFEQGGVFARGFGVVNGAGADEDEQARIATGEDAGDIKAGVEDGGRAASVMGRSSSRKTGGRTTLVHWMRRSSMP